MTGAIRAAFILLCVAVLGLAHVGAAAPPALDAATDPLPPGTLLRLGTARLRHPARIESLALSPDGRVVASADYEGRVRLWDFTTGKLRLELPPGSGSMVAFAPDGRALATADRWGRFEKPVRLWDARSGKLIRTFTALSGHCVALAADGKSLAGADDSNRVVLCEVDSGRVLRRLQGLKRFPVRLAFSRDGKALAGGDESWGTAGGYSVVIWDLTTGKERCRPLDKSEGWVRDVAFSPDGKVLGTATPYDASLWDAHTGKHLADLGQGRCNAVAFDNRGARLVTGGDDIHIRDARTRKIIGALHQGRNFASLVALSADGKRIVSNAVYDHRIRLWDAETGKQQILGPVSAEGHLDEVRAVAWAPDGKLIATGCGGDGTVRLWDVRTGKLVRRWPLPGALDHFSPSRDLSSLSFSHDGKVLTVAGRRWQIATGSETVLPVGRGRTAYSSDGKRIALSDPHEADVLLIQDETGRVLHRIHPSGKADRDDGRAFNSLAFSPDGRLLAVSSVSDRNVRRDQPAEASVHLWDATTGKRLRGLRPSSREPENLAFSPDGSLLATSEWRGQPELFDVATGRALFLLGGHPDDDRHWDGVRPLAFSPDGALLAVSGGQGEIVLWETASGQEVRVLKGHEGWVRALAFSSDGKRLLSGGADATALVWPTIAPPSGAGARATPDRLWAALATGAAEAHQALGVLFASPDQAVRLLKGRLRADEHVDTRKIGKFIADLKATDFEVRQKASEQLRLLGERARPALKRALAGKPDLEQLRRIERLLARLDGLPGAEELRSRRAIQALERLATPGAEAVLEELARGGEWGPSTRAATAALERLDAARQRSRPALKKSPAKPRVKPSKRLGAHEGEVHAVAFTPDGKTGLSAGRDGKIRRWDIGSGRELSALAGHAGGAFALAVSPDGKRLASGGADGKVCLWELPTGRLLCARVGHKGGSLCVAFGPDGLLASGGGDGRVRLWQADGKAALVIAVSEGRVASVGVTADGKRLVTGSTGPGGTLINGKVFAHHYAEPVRFWSLANGKPAGALSQVGHDVRLSRDGRLALVVRLATGAVLDGQRKGWTLEYSSQVVLRSANGTDREVLALKGCGTADLSTDGRFLLTGPGSDFAIGGNATPDSDARPEPHVRLFEAASGSPVLRLPVEAAAVALSPDGRWALLGSKNGAVHLSDLTPAKLAGAKPGQGTFSDLWKDLGDEDASLAYRAGWALSDWREKATPFLKARFVPAPADDGQLRRRIAELMAPSYVVRRDAFAALAASGRRATPALKAALREANKPQLQDRIEALLALPGAEWWASPLRLQRVAWVLDRIGTPEALEVKRLLGK